MSSRKGSTGQLQGIAGLVLGFGAGQGAMFLAQSWLVIQGELAYVGQVGLGLAGLSLAQLITDWGGVFILSRHAAQGRGDEFFSSANMFRFAVGLVVALILFVIAVIVFGPAERAVIKGGAAAVCIWSLNLVGMLDGLGRTAISGPISSLSWLLAACGLTLLDPADPEGSGFLIGLLFTIGAFLTVVLQYSIVMRAGRRVLTARPVRKQIIEFAREGGYYSLANVPAQLYGRALIIVANFSLGTEAAGAVVYARNVVTAATQAISFVRRVEFPALARLAAGGAGIKLRVVLRRQIWSMVAAVMFVVTVGILIWAMPYNVTAGSNLIGLALLSLSIPVPLYALSSAFGQAALAVGNSRVFAIVTNGGIALAVGIILIGISNLGILVFLVAESAMYLAQLVTYLSLFRHIMPPQPTIALVE